MKALIVIPSVGLVYGGPSKSVLELAEATAAQGVTVDLVTTTANGNQTLDVPTGVWLERHGIRVQYFPYFGWQDYKFSFKLAQWLYNHVQEYDLVHTNAIFSLSNLPAYWACQHHQIPYIITPHGMLEPWALAYKAYKKRLYYSLLEKPALQRAQALHLLATPEAEQIRPLHLKPATVIIPNGIHRQDFQTQPQPDEFYQRFPETRHKQNILFLGRIDPKKGLDLLAPAFAQLLQHHPNLHLIIAGPDSIGFLPTVQAWFQELGCLEAVTFTGMLTGDLKLSGLAAADLYVAPSYSEGFSMSVLEAMAVGLPCVITTGCNFPEAQTAQAAQVVEINTPALTAALSWCLENPDQAQVMGARAKQLVLENYTWDKIAAKMITTYQSIIDRKIV